MAVDRQRRRAHLHDFEGDGAAEVVYADWTSWNTFRSAGTELGPAHWRADRVPGEPESCDTQCFEDSVLVWVPVENRGLVTAVGASVPWPCG